MESVNKEWGDFQSELGKLEEIHSEYIKKLSELTKLQESSLKGVKHQNYVLKNLDDTLDKIKKDGTTDDKERLEKIEHDITDAKAKLHQMESELPVKDNGFYLSLILGKNLNLSLLSKNDRYKYKQDYESFKWKVTIAILISVTLSYLFPWRVLDSIGNFLMVWYYCTLTIRESVLRINGSRIKGWWVLHHYLSCVLCGIILTWRDGHCYQSFRHQFLTFVFYLCFVQILQTQYQSGCLRRLHALGQGHLMDITVEGFTSFMFKGLTFLLPFLGAVYVFQLYNAYVLWNLSYSCRGEWQVLALSFMFLLLAVGNIVTTSLVLLKKLRSTGSYNYIVGLTEKYRSRSNSKDE
ncbi:unnamed protein product [Cylicocyclus nassatus]|uniref:Uncharacterized protein n=2 Tax=Strongylidae TaxID=27830 RepID=A0AA36GX37_CYLNA|nr:unnamed protein product [Cylicocyclus nassatus]